MDDLNPLRAWRESQTPPLNQTEAADFVGASRAAWSRWENGLRLPDREWLPVLTRKTGIAPQVLRPDLAELMSEAAE